MLHTIHPTAGVWVSAQDMSGAEFELFWSNVSVAHQAGWLGGVVYGPHVRVPLTQFVARAAATGGRRAGSGLGSGGVSVRQYPDITHTLSSQFPVPNWHPAWSLTHGRQTVCPLPTLSAQIIRLRSNGSSPTVGAGVYTEGLGDDLNKAVWAVRSCFLACLNSLVGTRRCGRCALVSLRRWYADVLAGTDGWVCTACTDVQVLHQQLLG